MFSAWCHVFCLWCAELFPYTLLVIDLVVLNYVVLLIPGRLVYLKTSWSMC